MNINIFEYLDYRDVIKNFSKFKKITYKTLATSAGIHTSYFSRVMQNLADFNLDQLYFIGKDLQLKDDELEYFFLLGKSQAAASQQVKKYFLTQIENLQKKHNKLINKLERIDHSFSFGDYEIYYREVVTAKIHMLLTIDKYLSNATLILKKLNIDEAKLNEELIKLQSLNIIKIINMDQLDSIKIRLLKRSIHLEESNPLSFGNHINYRLENIQKLTKRRIQNSDYHFSVLFSSNEKTKAKIKELFKKFIVETQHLVVSGDSPEEIYFIGFDLY